MSITGQSRRFGRTPPDRKGKTMYRLWHLLFRRAMFRWVALVFSWLSVVGCATYDPTRDDRQSDLPWNTQQSWEGSIPMPGMH